MIKPESFSPFVAHSIYNRVTCVCARESEIVTKGMRLPKLLV